MPKQLELHLTPSPRLNEPLLTAAEAAALLSVRTSWVYEAARHHEVPHLRIGKHVRFLRSDLEQWLASRRSRA